MTEVTPQKTTVTRVLIPRYNTLYPVVLNKYKNIVFVETGIGKGQGIRCALDCGFERIYSCDINSQAVEICNRMYLDDKNVNIFNEKSIDFLQKVLNIENQSITFWLDAHVPECPILEELEVIKNFNPTNSIIMIDDLHCYESPEKKNWENVKVTVKQIMYKIIEINPNYQFRIEQRIRDNGVDGLSIYGTVIGGQILVAYL